MGIMPRMKFKETMKYRMGSTNESMNCRYCKFFKSLEPGSFLPGMAKGTCDQIPSYWRSQYRARADHRCDKQEAKV